MARFPFNIGRRASGGGKHLASKHALGRPQGRGPIRPPAMGTQHPVRVNRPPRPVRQVRVPAPSKVSTAGMVRNPVERRVSTAGMRSTGPVLGPASPKATASVNRFNQSLSNRMANGVTPRSGSRGRKTNPALHRAQNARVGSTNRNPIANGRTTPAAAARRGRGAANWVRSNKRTVKYGLGGAAVLGGGYGLTQRSGRGVDRTNHASSRGVYGY